MIKKIKESEILLPFSDYNKIESKIEDIIKSIVLIIIALLIGLGMLYYQKILCMEELNEFISNYIDVIIEIVVLLLSFSIAYLTIIITSDSENIKILKRHNTKIIIDNMEVSLYKVLLIQITYTIYNEIVLLIILLINKFIFKFLNTFANVLFLIIEIVLLLNIIYVVLKNVKNIYLSFWKDNLN